MKDFIITIDEIWSEKFNVRAETVEEAMAIAKKGYHEGVLGFEGTLCARQMSGTDPDTGDCTEWIEF